MCQAMMFRMSDLAKVLYNICRKADLMTEPLKSLADRVLMCKKAEATVLSWSLCGRDILRKNGHQSYTWSGIGMDVTCPQDICIWSVCISSWIAVTKASVVSRSRRCRIMTMHILQSSEAESKLHIRKWGYALNIVSQRSCYQEAIPDSRKWTNQDTSLTISVPYAC